MQLNKSETLISVHFPLAGLNAAAPFGQQPARDTGRAGYARTTRDALNVRARCPFTGRLRGGSRPGIAKWVETPVGG
jgi:hypothetical protein